LAPQGQDDDATGAQEQPAVCAHKQETKESKHMTTATTTAPTRIDESTDDWCPRVYRDLIVDDCGEQVILLHPVQARWAATNRTGLEIVHQFDGTVSIAAAAQAIADRHGIEEVDLVLEDVRSFVTRLYETNLLENMPLRPEHDTAHHHAPMSDEDMTHGDDNLFDLSIFVTEECNLRCKHCGYVEGKMYEHNLSMEEMKRVIDQHLELFPGSLVAFSGGEPLLRDDICEIVEYACARTKLVNINTNGLLMTEEIAARLAKTIAWVQISLDGADPEVHNFIRGKGMYDRAWAAIEMFCRHGGAKRLVISTTLTKCVLHQVQDMIAKADALGIRLLRFLTLTKQRAALTNWDRIAPSLEQVQQIYRFLLLDLPRMNRKGKTEIESGFPGYVPNADPSGEAWCPLGRMVLVDSLGNTYNCPTLNTDSHKTGNIKESSVAEIFHGERNRQTRQQMLGRRFAIEECRVCAWRNFCQGGCAAFTSLRTNSMYVNDEFCDFRRELYREHVRIQTGLAQGAPVASISGAEL